MVDMVLDFLYDLSAKTKETFFSKKDKLFSALITLMLGLSPVGGLYPFPWAYFLAKEKNDEVILACLCFCLFINGGGLLGITVAIGLYAFKRLLPKGATHPFIRLITATVVAAFLCMGHIESGVYGFAKSVATMSLIPLFTLLYGLYLTPTEKGGVAPKQAGLAAIIYSLALFFAKTLPWEAPVWVAVILISLVAARDGGMLCGGFFGFCVGLSCGAPCSAAGAICGLCTGLLFTAGGAIAVPLGCLAGLFSGLCFYGAEDMPKLMLCFFTAGICYFVFGNKISILPKDDKILVKDGRKSTHPFEKVFYELSESALIASGNKDGAARVATDYAAFSALLREAKLKEDDEEKEDTRLAERAEILLKGAGLYAEAVRVTGGRRKRLEAEGIAIDRLSLSSEQLKMLLSHALGGKLKQPEFALKNGKATLFMESAPLFRIECSKSALCKKGEKLSGDTVSFFSDNGYFYSLISDGMGSGKEAAVSSQLTGVFLEKLLIAGADRYSALTLLNGYLASRETEVFATVDLFEADLYTGRGMFLKAGAAPSLLMRDGKCKRLELESAPMGIIREIGAKQLSFTLKDSDLIVMFSDGVCGDGNCEETAAVLAGFSPEASTATIASALLAEAVKRTGKKDDMSIAVIKITKG